VLDVLVQDALEVAPPEDKQPVQALAPPGPLAAFTVRLRRRTSDSLSIPEAGFQRPGGRQRGDGDWLARAPADGRASHGGVAYAAGTV
jgi:hypothetical protein